MVLAGVLGTRASDRLRLDTLGATLAFGAVLIFMVLAGSGRSVV